MNLNEATQDQRLAAHEQQIRQSISLTLDMLRGYCNQLGLPTDGILALRDSLAASQVDPIALAESEGRYHQSQLDTFSAALTAAQGGN